MNISKYIQIIAILSLTTQGMSQNINNQTISYHPIGEFHTDYNTTTGAPRQGILVPENRGKIEIYPEFRDGLKTLGLFEYIIVIYHFSEVKTWEPIVDPPGSNHEHEFGLFATRSPKRPNPIGFSVIRLNKIENGILHVSGIDAFEGTPVLDIKPYLPSVDAIKSVQNELIEKELGHHDELFIDDSTFYK